MKRKLSALLLAALLLVSLSMTALAEDTSTCGAYNVKAESGYTLTPDGTADSGFMRCKRFHAELPGGTSGEQTLVLLLAAIAAYRRRTICNTSTSRPATAAASASREAQRADRRHQGSQRLPQHDEQGRHKGRVVPVWRETGVYAGGCRWKRENRAG